MRIDLSASIERSFRCLSQYEKRLNRPGFLVASAHLKGEYAPLSERFRALQLTAANWSLCRQSFFVKAIRDVFIEKPVGLRCFGIQIAKQVSKSPEFTYRNRWAVPMSSVVPKITQPSTSDRDSFQHTHRQESQIMTARSITHRILRAALAIAVLVQTAFIMPVGECGVSGSCCSESSTSYGSVGCCCQTKIGQTGVSSHACCQSAGPDVEVSSCCHSTQSTDKSCVCHCTPSKPAPVAPPTDSDTQLRLIPVYAYVAVAAEPAPAIDVLTGRMTCQLSLLNTVPRSVQVLFCTWQT